MADPLLKTGLTGLVITAICCFTPVPVWVFGAIGLGALVAYLDLILLPLLGLFLLITGYALWRRRKAA